MINKKGFTLIEMLVVVLIIGILAAIAVPQYQLSVEKSKFSELVLLVRDIKNQQEIFYLTNGYYATDCETLNPELPSGGYIPENNKKLIKLYKDSTKSIACSNGGGTRILGISKNANLELQLDQAERKNGMGESTGFCLAKTDLGHKLCSQIGQLKENAPKDVATIDYFF